MLKLLIPLVVSILLNTPVVELEQKQPTMQVATIQIEVPKYQTFEVTAYTAGAESTGKSPGHPEYGITASGKMVKENHTVACSKDIPFGTRFYIPYFDNTYVCEDRGGAIKEGKLDVYMPNLADALEFGRRELEVLVLDKPIEGR